MPGPMDGAPQAEAEVRVEGYDIDGGLDDMRRTRDYLASAFRMERQVRRARVLLRRPGHAFLGLTRLGADAAAAFHGSHIHRYLDEADAVTSRSAFTLLRSTRSCRSITSR